MPTAALLFCSPLPLGEGQGEGSIQRHDQRHPQRQARQQQYGSRL